MNLTPFSLPYDNTVMESFFSSLKHELIHHERFNSRDEARSRIFDYIELFYNRKRLHSTLGYRPPAQSEKMATVPNQPLRETGGSPT